MRRNALSITVATVVVILAGVLGARAQEQSQQVNQSPQSASLPADNNLPRLVLTFVLGDKQPGKGGPFTAAATKALADLKDFLPYQSYRLLDTVYMIGFGTPSHQVQGPDGESYDLIVYRLAAPSKLDLTLQLRNPRADVSPWLIDTSFKLAVGETVVVGTSRLDGNRALLVLVTWVK